MWLTLGNNNWPTKFRTFENLQAPISSAAGCFAAPWSREDKYALRLLTIYITPHRGIASPLFPERSALDVFAKIEELFPLIEGQRRNRGGPVRRASEDGRGSLDIGAAARHALQTLTSD